jgi:hypothetical protein
MQREINRHYRDPVDAIWLATARSLGIEVQRSNAAYASYDGKGVLTIAESEQFDTDDSLAQIVLHELCHALVAGTQSVQRADWGLSNTDQQDLVLEHACHRLQAALSDRHGLRHFFAVTTDHRPYWDALPADPLVGDSDPAIAIARGAFREARRGKWANALEAALEATARIATVVRPFTNRESLWSATQALHRSGFPIGADASQRCGQCAWLMLAGPGHALPRCRQTRDGAQSVARRVEPDEQGCARFEPSFDDTACGPCGACCRQGFDLVLVRPRDRVQTRHPQLIQNDRHGPHLPRPNGLCVALDGQGDAARPYRCRIYQDRPRACADFALRGDACLQARRRVGLSR